MIYLIFTTEGLAEAMDSIIEDKAALWVNPNVLTEQQTNTLTQANIDINELAEPANPSNEKSVVKALEYVEQITGSNDILVEYI